MSASFNDPKERARVHAALDVILAWHARTDDIPPIRSQADYVTLYARYRCPVTAYLESASASTDVPAPGAKPSSRDDT